MLQIWWARSAKELRESFVQAPEPISPTPLPTADHGAQQTANMTSLGNPGGFSKLCQSFIRVVCFRKNAITTRAFLTRPPNICCAIAGRPIHHLKLFGASPMRPGFGSIRIPCEAMELARLAARTPLFFWVARDPSKPAQSEWALSVRQYAEFCARLTGLQWNVPHLPSGGRWLFSTCRDNPASTLALLERKGLASKYPPDYGQVVSALVNTRIST